MALDGNEYTRIAVGGPGIAYGVVTDKAESAAIVVPGLEWTLPNRKAHFTLNNGKSHFTLKNRKAHFTLEED